MSRALVVALAGATVLLAAGCSNAVTGQPTGSLPAVSTTQTPTAASSAVAPTKLLPGGSEPPQSDETLVLGTNQLGTHQFNLDGVYDPLLVAQGVEFVLTRSAPSGYQLTGVAGAKCPDTQPITAGTSFTCTVNIDGQAKEVTVDIISNQGWYVVSAPR